MHSLMDTGCVVSPIIPGNKTVQCKGHCDPEVVNRCTKQTVSIGAFKKMDFRKSWVNIQLEENRCFPCRSMVLSMNLNLPQSVRKMARSTPKYRWAVPSTKLEIRSLTKYVVIFRTYDGTVYFGNLSTSSVLLWRVLPHGVTCDMAATWVSPITRVRTTCQRASR